ncbi:hypothetical protein AYL99_09765 [Fonsecaea erecta]|uniref:Uncharacterized protein n=1 Tax=Fonsecaea erecta TaxID=1367422 RepID=A0A178Z765_9EURO|nr:hypothetical protein AYL99_09765 [Fonsecaea erecta]OAP55614.1 hypothetical protein AYL99_09765 [Fonsecaea erecta]
MGFRRSRRGHHHPGYPLQDLVKTDDLDRQLKPDLKKLVVWLTGGCDDPDLAAHVEFPLPVDQFAQLEVLLHGEGAFEGFGLRYDYDADVEVLTVRKPNPKHGIIVAMTARRLRILITELHKHKQPFAASLASSLGSPYSAMMKYPSTASTCEIKRSPDIDIRSQMGDDLVPVLVGEVGSSQTVKSVNTKCKEYIQNTQGATRTAFAIDLGDPNGKLAYISIWRAIFDDGGKFQGATRDETVVIRNNDGNQNPDCKAGIVLTLEDFCPVEVTPRGVDLKSITMTLSITELFDVLEFAEEREEAARNKRERKD